jgi:hypothetical protein
MSLLALTNRESAHEFVVVFRRKGNQESVQETHQVEHQVEHARHPLTAKQKDVINYCSVSRTAKEIMDRFGVYNQSRSRKIYPTPN